MKGEMILQDNRITMARYELSLIEKRVLYCVIRDIRKKFVLTDKGQKDLFDDLVIRFNSSELVKEVYEDNKREVKKALKSLRQRSFEYCENEDTPDEHWFETGFINYGDWSKDGVIEVQVSKKILPFFVELTRTYTQYNLIVAMALKSKWSQRMYELCSKWKSVGGFQIEVDELRKSFKLEDRYAMFGALRLKVLDVAQKELKALYDEGQCNLYFNFSEVKTGRKVTGLRFKVVSKDSEESKLSVDDKTYITRDSLERIFDAKKYPKNKALVDGVMRFLVFNGGKLDEVYNKIDYVKNKIDDSEQARYLRFVINDEGWLIEEE